VEVIAAAAEAAQRVAERRLRRRRTSNDVGSNGGGAGSLSNEENTPLFWSGLVCQKSSNADRKKSKSGDARITFT